MGLFDNLKDMHALKKHAEEIQMQMINTKIEGFSRDEKYKVVINGNNELLELVVPESNLQKIDVQQGIIEAFTNARHKLENVMREKMMSQI